MKTFPLLALSLVVLTGVFSGCSAPTQKCDATTCAGGCCDSAGACQPGFAPAACGTAGNLCTTCFAGQVCNLGLCQSTGFGGGTGTGGGAGGGTGTGGGAGGGGGSGQLTCSNGRTACSGSCVNTQTDSRNCGFCGTLCTSSQYCSNGSCSQLPPDCSTAGCPTGFFCSGTQCKRGCASNTDCPQPGLCDTRTATCSCAAGTHGCGSTCESDTSVSACGPSCASCEGIADSVPACSNNACDFSCNTGFHRCGSTCANNDDVASCGANCAPCQVPANGTALCTNRQCDFVCNTGFHRCGDLCVSNVATATCGSSCSACQPPANGTATCNGVACDFTCNTGYHRCGNVCVSNTSTATCGSSCTACAPPSNATATCNGVSCGFSCNTGTHACSGACVSNSSINSCGTSSCVACSPPLNAVATCNGTACDFQCDTGYHRCGSTCRLDTDVNYCGSTCTICATGPTNSTRTCTSGTCGSVCNAGYHLCGGVCVLDSSTTQCGASCQACTPPANASPLCTGGACDFACNSGFHKCGSLCVSNTSVDGCGTTSCTPCADGPPNSARTCNGTSCGFACNSGFNSCGGQCVGDDYVSACGASCALCTVSTAAEKPTCTAGTCGTGCITTCNLACVDVMRDPGNCGMCGVGCGGGEACVLGQCRPTCAGGVAFTGVLPYLPAIAGSSGYRFVVEDLNGDGRADLVDNGPTAGLNVRLANAGGSYGSPTLIGLSAKPSAVLVVDLNGDGYKDLVATRPTNASQVAVVFNSAGGFLAPTYLAMSTAVPSPAVFVADVNGDTRLDIVVPSSTSTTTTTGYYFTQTATGTFNTVATFTNGLPGALYSATGDFNKDGRTDYVVATANAYRVALQTTTPGTWTQQTSVAVIGLGSVVAADYNNDTNLDLVFRAGINALLVPGNGDGTFATSVTFPPGGAGNVLAVDVSGDGVLDLVTPSSETVWVSIASAPGTFGTPTPWRVPLGEPGTQVAVAAAQLEGSVHPELFSWTLSTGTAVNMGILLNDGTGQFPASRVSAYAPTRYYVAAGDFDGDGDRDALVYDDTAGTTVTAVVMPGDNAGNFGASVQTLSIRSNELAVGRLNGDQADDLVFAGGSAATTSVDVFLTSGTSPPFVPRTSLLASAVVQRVLIADLNGDANNDVIVGTTTGIDWFPGNGNGTFGARQTAVSTGGTVQAFAVADLNLDGRVDLVVKTNHTSANVRVYPAIIAGGFATAPLGTSPYNGSTAYRLHAADFDGDGRPDLLVHTSSSIVVYKGQGNGTLATTPMATIGGAFDFVRVGDLDGDGFQDVVTTGFDARVHRGQVGGTFLAPLAFGVGRYPNGGPVLVDRLNGDTRLDLLFATDFNELHALLGTCR